MPKEKAPFPRYAFILPFTGLVALWLILLVQIVFHIDPGTYGVKPKDTHYMWGIITYPLVHGGIGHLAANSLPLLFLGIGILYFYREVGWKVISLVWLISGIFIWLIGREGSEHIGASGLIYGFAAFLFFGGLFRRNTRLMGISLLVSFLYGGMIWGVLPLEEGVSWEGHFGGALAGVVCAWIFRHSGPKKDKPETQDEEYGHHHPHIGDYFEVKPTDED